MQAKYAQLQVLRNLMPEKFMVLPEKPVTAGLNRHSFIR